MSATNMPDPRLDYAALEIPPMRFNINESTQILRMSRAQLYKRIASGDISIQKDGARTYVSLRELERYVDSCERRSKDSAGR